MHTGAAGSGDHQERAIMFDGMFDGHGDFFPAAGGKRAAEESEIHDGENDSFAVDISGADDHGFALAEFLHGCGGLFGVRAFGVGEMEVIARKDFRGEFAESSVINQQGNALTAIDAIVVVAFRANHQIRFPFFLKHVSLAFWADMPDIGQRFLWRGCVFGKPSHDG